MNYHLIQKLKLQKKDSFFKFSKGFIKKNDVKPISYKEKNPFKKIAISKILNTNGVESLLKE